MRCETTNDAEVFWQQAHAWLETEPVLYSVILGQAGARRSGAVTDAAPPTFAVVRDGSGSVCGVAMRTPPFHAYISQMPPEAVEVLVDTLLEVCPDNDGVTGTKEQAAEFARLWSQRTGREPEVRMRQRIHALDTVVPARPVPGEVRLANVGDRDLLVAWTEAFEIEAEHGLGVPSGTAARNVDQRLAEDRAYVWDDGGVVSYTGITHAIAGVVRIGPVYTPPALRGRGYASVLVAAVSQGALDAGARQCSLYTDLANPTSNKIYAAVGYRPVTDVMLYKFTERKA